MAIKSHAVFLYTAQQIAKSGGADKNLDQILDRRYVPNLDGGSIAD